MSKVADDLRVGELFKTFTKSRYPEKVALFEKHFGLIPFTFPPFDISLAWYLDPEQLNALFEILSTEKRELHSLYRRSVSEGRKIYRFSVLPIYIPERKFLNEYLLNRFLEAKNEIRSRTHDELKTSLSPVAYLEEKIVTITHTLEWLPLELNKNPLSVQTKFLQIFYNGMIAANTGKTSNLTVRRKFVEIFLYAQGLLMMDHFNFLSSLYASQVKVNSLNPLPVKLKLVLLHDLGILEYIREKFQNNGGKDGLDRVAGIISLLTSEQAINYNEVFRYLAILGTGHPGDPLTKTNQKFVIQKILGLSPDLGFNPEHSK